MLVRKNLFKVFTFAVGYLWAQAYGSNDRHSELGNLSEGLRRKIGKFHNIDRTTERLKSSTPAVQNQALELTRGFCQLLAWSNYVPKKDDGVETDWEDYNKCLSLINVVESLPMSEEDRALFCASGAKIRLKKLEYLVKQDGFEDSEKEEKLRKIYDLFMESRSIRDRKQCRVEIAGLILRWRFSPTSSLEEDYEIAAKMLPYPSPRGGVGVAGGEAGGGDSGGALAHLDDSLPNGNSVELKEEERLLRLLLEERHAALEAVASVAPVAPVAMDDVSAQEVVPLLSAVLVNVPAAEIATAAGMQEMELEVEVEVVSAFMDDVHYSSSAMVDVPAQEAAAEVEYSGGKKRKRKKKRIIVSDDEEDLESSKSPEEPLVEQFVTPIPATRSMAKHFTFEEGSVSDDEEPRAKRHKKGKKSPSSDKTGGSLEVEDDGSPRPGTPAFSRMIRTLGASARL